MKARLTLLQALGRPKTIFSILLVVGASLSCFVVSELIQFLYPDRPIVPDILFTLLPDIPWLAYTTDPIMGLAIALIVYYVFTRDKERMPYYFFTVAITYAMRAPLMLLTPLGRPTGNLSSYGIFEVFNLKQHGMFPSGHVILVTTFYFLIDGLKHPRFKWAAGILGLLEIVTLILSRGHYSVDAAGGVMVGYIAVVALMQKHKGRFQLEPKAGRKVISVQ